MNLEKTFASAAVVAALSLVPIGAQAQDRGGHERGGGRSQAGQPAARNDGGGQATVRQAPRQAPTQARQEAPRPQGNPNPQYSAPPPARVNGGPQAVPRENRQYGTSGPSRGYGQYGAQQAPRPYATQPAPRSYGQYGGQPAPRQAVPRPPYQYGGPAYRGYGNGGYGNGHYGAPVRGGGPAYRPNYARPYYGSVYVRPYGWNYRPYYFSRPYYSFRPWFSIGFGFSVGYSVPYPYTYLGTYRPRVYGGYGGYDGYGYDGGYSTSTDVSVNGGLSFDIQPSDADVWVDDQYVGTVAMFTPNGEPLTLTPGQHRIVVQRDGFRSMEWDATIEPGQVIPYRGQMQR